MSRARNFCFTWNTPPDNWRSILHAKFTTPVPAIKYIVGALEFAPTTGQPHVQGYVAYSNAATRAAIQQRLTGCHISIANGTALQNRQYCLKLDSATPNPLHLTVEWGNRPLSQEEKGEAGAAVWEAAWDSAVQGQVMDIPVKMRVSHYNTWKRIRLDNAPRPEDLPEGVINGIWIWGPSGTGKSHSVRQKYTRDQLYLKDRTKWWCGYNNEPVAYIEDMSKFNPELGGYFKVWADRYAFKAEGKGCHMEIRPKLLVVTSNYSMDEVWGGQEQELEPLRRRFKVIFKGRREDDIIDDMLSVPE